MFFQKNKKKTLPKIYLFNTLGRKKEQFKPIKNGVAKMYTCGPTVYNYLHIGNLRAYVFADTIKRVLEINNLKVEHIINITDIGHLTSDADEGEDKMVKALKRENKPFTLDGLKEVAEIYTKAFQKDFEEINIITPEKYVVASEHIKEESDFVAELVKKGFAYPTSDGIYFDTKKLPDYGMLGGADSEMESRIGVNSEKKSPRDFALWKFADNNGIGFDSALGKGFPGWHIECSAMAMEYLGNHFDIHTGGVDHIPVHHNNEIAQSEALTGELLANYWIHSNHLTIKQDNKESKMAKSGENFITLQTLKEKGISPLAYRYWLLTSKYSTRVDYSLEAIEAAQNAYKKLLNFVLEINSVGKINTKYFDKFIEAVNDDLETPKAIAIMWDLIKDSKISDADKKSTILEFDKVLGLGLASAKKQEIEITEEIKNLLEERKLAKEDKDFKKSDEIRNKIKSLGFEIKDTPNGQEITR